MHGFNWDYIWNGFWCVIVIMTTGYFDNLVGYGDFYPSGLLGRMTVVCACAFGPFMISTITYAINNAINFNYSEQKVIYF